MTTILAVHLPASTELGLSRYLLLDSKLVFPFEIFPTENYGQDPAPDQDDYYWRH